MSTSELGILSPRVFVSSTIRDFGDLRSALRYWLESAGYDVQLSEYTDFDRRPEADTFEACFANVAASDYYILLVGGERGSWYREDERISVSRQEFRVASHAAGTRPLRIIVFVRAEVATALQQWRDDGCPSSGSSVLRDPAFTQEFLQEVEKETEDSDPTGSRWIYKFGDFRDIIDALRVVLRLDTNIERRLLQDNLLNELLYNLSLLATKTERHNIFPKHWWCDSVRREITIRKGDIGQLISLTSKQMSRLAIAALIYPGKALRHKAISEGLMRGLYLTLAPRTGEIQVTDAHRSLQALHDDIVFLVSSAESDQVNQILLDFMELGRRANRGELGAGTGVPAENLTILLRLYDTTEDVFKGIVQFAQWILGATESPRITRNPPSPIEGASEKIEAERATAAELKWALENRIRPFGEKLTPDMRDIAMERTVEALRANLPVDLISDEALADIVREDFDDLVVEPFQEQQDDASGNQRPSE